MPNLVRLQLRLKGCHIMTAYGRLSCSVSFPNCWRLVPTHLRLENLSSCTYPAALWHQPWFLQGSHFIYPIKFPEFSLTFPWFPKIFPWLFFYFLLRHFSQKRAYLFFLNVALVTLVYANIASLSAISWQFLKERFYILKKHFTSD